MSTYVDWAESAPKVALWVRRLLAFLRICPVTEHPDGSKYVRIRDHWLNF